MLRLEKNPGFFRVRPQSLNAAWFNSVVVAVHLNRIEKINLLEPCRQPQFTHLPWHLPQPACPCSTLRYQLSFQGAARRDSAKRLQVCSVLLKISFAAYKYWGITAHMSAWMGSSFSTAVVPHPLFSTFSERCGVLGEQRELTLIPQPWLCRRAGEVQGGEKAGRPELASHSKSPVICSGRKV